MSLPEAYQREIEVLNDRILQSGPSDVLQFCADFFASRLASERAAFLSKAAPAPETEIGSHSIAAPSMSSGPGFTSPFGANSNPFGSSEARRTDAAPPVMQQVIEEEDNDTVTSPTTPSFALTSGGSGRTPLGLDGPSDAAMSSLRSPPPGEYPAQYNFSRRTSVSAESLKPVADSYDNWSPPLHAKTPEQLSRLQHAIEGNFLFSHLDEEQSAQILGALVEKPIPTKDIKVGRPSGVAGAGTAAVVG